MKNGFYQLEAIHLLIKLESSCKQLNSVVFRNIFYSAGGMSAKTSNSKRISMFIRNNIWEKALKKLFSA